MTLRDNDIFQAIWQGEAPPTLHMSTEQLDLRARQLETEVRRRNLRDLVCFALVAAAFMSIVVVSSNLLVRVGSAMLVAWAIYSTYGLHRFGSHIKVSDANQQSCAAYHRLQLERQRDIALSWPWGAGLAMPGMVLFAIGLPLYAPRPQWTFSIVLICVFFFTYAAVVIHGKRLAREWQRELDML